MSFNILSIGMGLTILTSCTYSINMVHTEGTASDVVDETQSPKADVDATASVPISGI